MTVIWEPDPETKLMWVEVPFRGLLLKAKIALRSDPQAGLCLEIVDFIPPPHRAWDWDYIDANSTEILMNIPLELKD